MVTQDSGKIMCFCLAIKSSTRLLSHPFIRTGFLYRWVGSKIYRRYFWHIYSSFGNRSDFMPKMIALVIYLCRPSLFRPAQCTNLKDKNSAPHFCLVEEKYVRSAESLFMDFHFLSDHFAFLSHYCLFCFLALSAIVLLRHKLLFILEFSHLNF